MKNKLAVAAVCVSLFIFTSCTGEQEQSMSKQEFINPNAGKQILVLTKATEYRGKLIERLVKRIQKTYSFTVDDVAKATDYNFMMYQKVIWIESAGGKNVPYLDSYFNGYTGVNNIILLALTNEQNFSSELPVPMVVTSANIENVNNTAEVLIEMIRQR